MLTSLAVEWPEEFYAVRRGEGCGMCEQGRPDETPWGIRIFAGEVSDAYLQKIGYQRGYIVVVWRGRHVAEPTELDPGEAAAYWLEVLQVGRVSPEGRIPARLHGRRL